MTYKINFETYSDNFSLPSQIADENLSTVNGDYLKVILLIFRNSNKNYSINLISNLLNLPEKCVKNAIDYWISHGVLLEQSLENLPQKNVVVLQKHRPHASVPTRVAGNVELSFLLECMENLLGRTVSTVEYKSVAHILETIKLPADVVLMALEYCISIGKVSTRYIETVCANWADNGITTHEAAEQYLSFMKKEKQHQGIIQKIFGIENRALTTDEQNAVSRWFNEYQFDQDVITYAYERTIGAIGKISFPYTDKILLNWKEKGYTDLQSIMDNENGSKKMVSVKEKSSYDLDELERYWDTVPKLD